MSQREPVPGDKAVPKNFVCVPVTSCSLNKKLSLMEIIQNTDGGFPFPCERLDKNENCQIVKTNKATYYKTTTTTCYFTIQIDTADQKQQQTLTDGALTRTCSTQLTAQNGHSHSAQCHGDQQTTGGSISYCMHQAGNDSAKIFYSDKC